MAKGMWERNGEELGREKGKLRKEGCHPHPAQHTAGDQGTPSPCPLFIQAKAQRAFPVFTSLFQCVPTEPKPSCDMLTMPFTLLSFGLFSKFVVVSQDHVLGPYHLFSEVIIFRPVMWKAMT